MDSYGCIIVLIILILAVICVTCPRKTVEPFSNLTYGGTPIRFENDPSHAYFNRITPVENVSLGPVENALVLGNSAALVDKSLYAYNPTIASGEPMRKFPIKHAACLVDRLPGYIPNKLNDETHQSDILMLRNDVIDYDQNINRFAAEKEEYFAN